jgi:poly(3-hydroxyalkanoate) synthetase
LIGLLFVLALFCSTTLFADERPPVVRELQWAVTPEKFELALERLRTPSRAGRRFPVILTHGLFVGSFFLNLDEETSLARYLARAGFDVWNLSLRGTGRSLNPLKGGLTKWTLDDIIEKDLAAVIRHVKRETGRPKVFWLGYELGGALMYGYAGKRATDDIAGLVAIGTPMTFNDPAQEPVRRLLKLEESPALKKIFLSTNVSFFSRIAILVPRLEGVFYNRDNMEDAVKSKLLEEALIEIRPGVLDHVLSIVKRGEFVSVDGGINYWKNLGRIQVPLLAIGGEKDPIAPSAAMRAVQRAVGSADKRVRIFGPRAKDKAAYGHLDLVVGVKAKEEVFPAIRRWLEERSG